MDFALLRAKLDNIAEELAQLPEQETVAIEEENHEKDEDGNVIFKLDDKHTLLNI